IIICIKCTLKLERRMCLRIRFSGGDNARSVKASAGQSSEGWRKQTAPEEEEQDSSLDEVVKLSPHARAIRDVEDEELRSFFFGM
ncbi:unnamed protein product, partial [Brassica napus]